MGRYKREVAVKRRRVGCNWQTSILRMEHGTTIGNSRGGRGRDPIEIAKRTNGSVDKGERTIDDKWRLRETVNRDIGSDNAQGRSRLGSRLDKAYVKMCAGD